MVGLSDKFLVFGCSYCWALRLFGRLNLIHTSGVFLFTESYYHLLISPSLGSYKIPTWTSPLFVCVFVSLLALNTSFLGHLCAILIGYLCKYIQTPAKLILTLHSRPWIPQDLCPTREGPSMD